MMYKGFNFDVLDDGCVFIWYKTNLVGVALDAKYAKKRVDSIIKSR